MQAELGVLEGAVGYRFRDRGFLCRALTHKSHVYEKSVTGEVRLADNEQLEFLGDAILGFLVSECLLEKRPALPEGRLSKLKAHLVSAAHLYHVAQNLGLGKFLLLGRGEELSGGRAKRALLANAVEALIAAIYLDADLGAARRFVIQHVVGDLDAIPEGERLPLTDYKSALQEAAQARGLPPPRYTTVKERGPEHAKLFTVEVRIGREWVGQAEALSKKSAGQKAAQILLEKLVGS